ncbi:MAG: adenosine deaminase [Oscillospiraceae bacterium]|nr:adenosine deaminase [Oscillospiraceae bacterium]
MSYFGKLYLDKEKDIVVNLDMENGNLSYTILANNHKSDNLINNLAAISGQASTLLDGRTVITGDIPCYIKGDGQQVYILRINGTKIANIYPDGKIEVNSLIPAIAKTLMSQTKDYKYSFRETLLKSYVPQQVKLSTDLHTHGNANLNADILIALAIKHQIRYPLYYIKKLGLVLTGSQQAFIDRQRRQVAQSIDLSGLSGKYLDRKIDDNTFINFAALILQNIENSTANINKIRMSLTILKDSQAVFTNLEKLYLYRYVFTKGVPSDYKIRLVNTDSLEDADIRSYLDGMLADNANPDYAINTLYEDTLLWIGREYSKKFIRYVEISDTTLVKKDRSNVRMLSQLHRILPLVKAETGVDIRFLTAIRRIPLTLVKENITSSNYLTEAIQALKVVCKDPYVVGSDFVGEEINDIAELKAVIKEIVTQIAVNDRNWTIRIHAGENDSLKTNMSKAISLVEESLLPGQPFPYMRIGHGLYGASLKSKQGKDLLAKIRQHDVVLEFQLTSNVRLNNIIDLKTHPLKSYLARGISCVMGTDGCGMYGTDSVDEQLALTNLLKVTDDEFMQMKQVEDAIISRQTANFAAKSAALHQRLGGLTVEDYYSRQLSKPVDAVNEVKFEINKQPSYPVFRGKIKELPWNKYPVVIAGGSFTSGNASTKVSDADKRLLQSLLDNLDPDKVFFVVGHKLSGQEKYIVQHNTKFEVYSIVPSLMDRIQIRNLSRAKIAGIRLSTESREMGIYKSFNYEIFERRNCVLIAFDGNSSVANLVQEARNGKARAYIFIYPKSAMLKAKARSLEGYVTINAPVEQVIAKIRQLEDNIGTKL